MKVKGDRDEVSRMYRINCKNISNYSKEPTVVIYLSFSVNNK